MKGWLKTFAMATLGAALTHGAFAWKIDPRNGFLSLERQAVELLENMKALKKQTQKTLDDAQKTLDDARKANEIKCPVWEPHTLEIVFPDTALLNEFLKKQK